MSDIDDIRSALSYIEPQDRDTWWQMGAAIKDELGENGFDMWDEWSRQADNYNARDAQNTWKSLKPGMWHIESVWKIARQNGWKPSKPFTQPSMEELARRKAESEAKRQAAEAEQQQAKAKAQRTAQTIWRNSKPATTDHPYLLAKGITDTAAIAGLRQNQYKGDDNLVIPVLHDNQIINLQTINQDGGKRFLSGGQVQGGYAFIGKSEDVEKGVVIAEGWATAASIHQATSKPVIIAFNAGNMVTVAERLSQTLPQHTPVIIAVDNDASQTGIKKAEQAAAFFGERATSIQPEFTMTQIQQYQRGKGVDVQGRPPLPSDFNDLHQLAGIETVRDQMNAGIHILEKNLQKQENIMAQPTDIAAFNGTNFIRELKSELDKNLYTPQEDFINNQAFMKADGSYLRADNQRLGLSLTANAKEGQPVKIDFARIQGDYSREYSVLIDNHEQSPAQLLTALAKTAQTWEQERGSFPKSEQQKSIETNTIEFDGREQVQETVREPETEPNAKQTKQQESEIADVAARPSESKKAILDLEYRIPDSIKTRYHAIGGKFYSAADGQTVLFEDKGRKLSTSRQDPQTVKDMLEVVKAKGWDNIKLSGTREFKQMMFIEAAAQGIQTRGYTPTEADWKQVETLREQYARNGVEAVVTREREIEPKQTAAEAPKPEQEPQPDQKQQVEQPEPEREEKVYKQPDRELMSAADRMEAQSSLPSESQINSSPRADTDIDIPIRGIGQEEVPAEVLQQTDNMRVAAQDTGLVAVKTTYMNKAQKLSKPEQKKLAFYERGVMDSIRGLTGEVRTQALRNYYEHTAEHMKGSKLNLPHPIQIPSPNQTQTALIKQEPMQQSQSMGYDGHEPEFSR